MLSQEKILDLVGRIYDAASDEQLWPAFLQDFADAVKGTVTGMFFYDWSQPGVRLDVATRFDPEFARKYVEYYNSVNPWIRAWRKHLNRAGLQSVSISEERVPIAELEKTEFYSDYLLPQDTIHQMGCILTKTDQTCSALTCLRSRHTGSFGPAEVKLLKLLFPHLNRAMQFHRNVAALKGQHRASVDALDRLPTGVILLDDQGRVVLMALRENSERVAIGGGLSVLPFLGWLASDSSPERPI